MIKLKDILNEVINVDINQIASTLTFKPVTKQKLVYKYIDGGKPGFMPPMTYTKSTIQQPVVTITSDGKETQNTADVGDIIFSGATGPQGPQGPTGATGAGLTILGSVATVGNLPGSGNVGDAYIVTADSHLYVWNGSSWTDAGLIVGPQDTADPLVPYLL